MRNVIIIGILCLLSGCVGFYVGQYAYALEMAAAVREAINATDGFVRIAP